MKKPEASIAVLPSKKAPHPTDVSGCVVCGTYEGKLDDITASARAHEACAAARPDVIAKVKARA
jgi:hypothetical protein